MRFFRGVPGLLFAMSISVANSQVSILSNVTTPSLNFTVSTARNGASILQCWSLPGFAASATSGTVGALNLFLGDTTNASFTILPPRFDGGVHAAPVPQLVFFLSGLIHVTIPNVTTSESSAWIQGGKNGLVGAFDTKDVTRYGHISTYPSAADTVAVQFPLSVEGHQSLLARKEVLYEGGCKESELVGI